MTYSKYRSREAIDKKLDEIQGDLEYNEDDRIPIRRGLNVTEMVALYNPETHHELIFDDTPVGNEIW